jgi:hypothetical protein
MLMVAIARGSLMADCWVAEPSFFHSFIHSISLFAFSKPPSGETEPAQEAYGSGIHPWKHHFEATATSRWRGVLRQTHLPVWLEEGSFVGSNGLDEGVEDGPRQRQEDGLSGRTRAPCVTQTGTATNMAGGRKIERGMAPTDIPGPRYAPPSVCLVVSFYLCFYDLFYIGESGMIEGTVATWLDQVAEATEKDQDVERA